MMNQSFISLGEILYRGTFFSLCLTLFCTCVFTQELPVIRKGIADETALAEQNKKVIDGILKDLYDKHDLPGGISMAISYRGRLVYAGAVGFADKEHNIPLTPEHRMRLASVSKPITAIAIMKLIEDQ